MQKTVVEVPYLQIPLVYLRLSTFTVLLLDSLIAA